MLVNGVVKVGVALYRDHASAPSEKTPAVAESKMNPQGILEAYWCYVEGVKPDAQTPNSLIGAQPMVVKSLDEAFVSLEVCFRAPPTAGKYPIKVHVISTSVIGIDQMIDAEFCVVEDDVPDLE